MYDLPKKVPLNLLIFEYQSGSIILHAGQYCQGIAYHDCTLSIVRVIWQQYIVP